MQGGTVQSDIEQSRLALARRLNSFVFVFQKTYKCYDEHTDAQKHLKCNVNIHSITLLSESDRYRLTTIPSNSILFKQACDKPVFPSAPTAVLGYLTDLAGNQY